MKHLRRRLQPHSVMATVLAVVWLPYAGTRCLENPAGPRGSAGSVNCIFGHHEPHRSSSGHHHGEVHTVGGHAHAAEPGGDRNHGHASGNAGRHDQGRDETCCTQTGKRSVIPSTHAGSEPPVAIAALWPARSYRPPLAGHPDQRALAPVAHSPPIYLRNASLLI